MEILIKNIHSQKDLQLITELAERLGGEAMQSKEENAADERKRLILAERELYLNSSGISFSRDEVKAMAQDKSKRHGRL